MTLSSNSAILFSSFIIIHNNLTASTSCNFICLGTVLHKGNPKKAATSLHRDVSDRNARFSAAKLTDRTRCSVDCKRARHPLHRVDLQRDYSDSEVLGTRGSLRCITFIINLRFAYALKAWGLRGFKMLCVLHL